MSTSPVSVYGPTYGSLYFAAVLSTAFYGVTCMQTFFYFVHYQNDPWYMKTFTAALWALNTIHEGLSVAGVYRFILAGLLSPSSFTTGNLELILLYLFTALVAIPTQGFFVYRIYAFSGKRIAAPLVWVVLALVQFVCTAMYIAVALRSSTGSGLEIKNNVVNGTSFQILATLYLSVGAGIDVMIAICMTVLLARERIATKFATTAHVLQRLTVFSVNTGVWTATFALLSIIFLHVFPSNLIYAVFTIPLCPLYCNALLANLNARAYLGSEPQRHGDTDFFETNLGCRTSVSTRGNEQRREVKLSPDHARIWQTVEVLQFRDTCQPTTEND